jgi:hypothetical protein
MHIFSVRKLTYGMVSGSELAEGEEKPESELAYRERSPYELAKPEYQSDPELSDREEAECELAYRYDPFGDE